MPLRGREEGRAARSARRRRASRWCTTSSRSSSAASDRPPTCATSRARSRACCAAASASAWRRGESARRAGARRARQHPARAPRHRRPGSALFSDTTGKPPEAAVTAGGADDALVLPAHRHRGARAGAGRRRPHAAQRGAGRHARGHAVARQRRRRASSAATPSTATRRPGACTRGSRGSRSRASEATQVESLLDEQPEHAARARHRGRRLRAAGPPARPRRDRCGEPRRRGRANGGSTSSSFTTPDAAFSAHRAPGPRAGAGRGARPRRAAPHHHGLQARHHRRRRPAQPLRHEGRGAARPRPARGRRSTGAARPSRIDYPSLDGQLQLDVESGPVPEGRARASPSCSAC